MNLKSLILLLETLPVELTEIYYLYLYLYLYYLVFATI